MNQLGQIVEAFRAWLGTMEPGARWMTVTIIVAFMVGLGHVLMQSKLRLPLLLLSWIFFWPLPAGFLLARVIGWRKVLLVWAAGLFAAWGWFKAGVAPIRTLTLVAILAGMVMVFSSYTFKQLIRTQPRGIHDLREQFSRRGRQRFIEQSKANRSQGGERRDPKEPKSPHRARCPNCSKFVRDDQVYCPECDPAGTKAAAAKARATSDQGYYTGPPAPGFEPKSPWAKWRRRQNGGES